jgi:hypothetical protein
MTRHVLTCALVLTLVGCEGRQEPAEPVEVLEVVEAADPVEAPPTDQIDPADRPGTVGQTPEPQAPTEAEAAEPGTSAPATRDRDLATELRDAVGSPADCLEDYRPKSATTIRVRISAVVRPTGMIIEPSASGRGLSMNDQRCIAERVGGVTLEPLAGRSSEPVSTYVDIRYQPPTVETYDVAPPPPQPDDVVQPLPKKKPIAPSGVPIEGPAADPIEGPSGVPIEGPKGVPIEGPKPVPIESD